MRALTPVLLALLSAVPALAQTSPDLSTVADKLRAAAAVSVARSLALAVKPAQAADAKPGTSLTCRSADGRSVITATVSADRRTLENNWSGRSSAIDGTKPYVDERCGTTAMPLASALSFEITAPHNWGQDIVQFRPADLDGAAAKFSANLHTCSYDGSWSASDDVALTCERTAP
jgi:hypothetical protein